MKLSELFLNRFLYRDNTQNLETKDSAFVSADSETPPPATIPSGGAAQDINTSNVTINGAQITPGTIPAEVLDVSNWGWGQTSAFTSTDLNTVSWGAGTFKSASGVTYSIGAGNTGNMAAKTYIYLDLNVSTTAYQTTTTSANAVGLGKVLVAVAQNAAVSATYMLSEATQIVSDNIIANTIDASKIVAGQLIVSGGAAADVNANSTTIVGGKIRTGNIESTGYTYVSGNFSSVGMQINLDNGVIRSPNFAVDASGNAYISGNITAGSGSIGSFTIGTYLYTGSKTAYNDANAGVHIGGDGIGFGNNVFTVSAAGALVATSATVSGSITATSGSIAGSLVTSGISAGNITTDTLSAITVQTSSGNSRIKLISDTMEFYSGGVLKATLDGSAAGAGGVKNTGDFFIANNRTYWITSSGGGSSEYGGVGITSSNEFWLTLGTANTFFIKNNAQNANYFTVSSVRSYINGYLYLQPLTANPSSLPTGAIWCFNNGSDQFRGTPTGATVYSFDMTVV